MQTDTHADKYTSDPIATAPSNPMPLAAPVQSAATPASVKHPNCSNRFICEVYAPVGVAVTHAQVTQLPLALVTPVLCSVCVQQTQQACEDVSTKQTDTQASRENALL